ncbi:unnamed protein product [Cylicocyclus nassatus]|uniref:ShKT domain-containing protein n=1 Tax=Cylicocyclus nassatus TaxID=53992 RepID=A0AA36MAS4_CYLNA|nr:unnamed protein product [Cylicocyclus nassatus]
MQILVLSALCFEVHATVTLEECLDKDKKYAEEAFACEDVATEKVCNKFFPAPTTAPTVGADVDRQEQCWKGDSGPDDEIIAAAIDLCPKTCALCCKTAAFDCEDDESFDCVNLKKKNQCKDPWKTQLNLVEKCPKTCGLCEEKNGACEDAEPNCDKEQCKNTDFQAAMKVNCKKTCGFCDEETTAAAETTAPAETTKPAQETTMAEKTTAPAKTEPTTTPLCGSDPRCDKWIQNGFCTNNLYPDEYKAKYCGKACGKC